MSRKPDDGAVSGDVVPFDRAEEQVYSEFGALGELSPEDRAKAQQDAALQAMQFFATEDTETVYLVPPSPPDLPKGVWFTMKRYLSYGEQRRVETAAMKGMSPEQLEKHAAEAERKGNLWLFDFEQQSSLKLATYIVDWNLPGPDGKTVRWPKHLHERMLVVRQLNAPIGDLISSEIDRVIGRSEKVRAADVEDGDASDPTSRSVVAIGAR